MRDSWRVGLVIGAAWNLANLWCLQRLLAAWFAPPPSASPKANADPSGRAMGGGVGPEGRDRVRDPRRSAVLQGVGWLLIKFPLLYGTAWWCFSRLSISLIGFGIGFTLILLAAMAKLLLQARRMVARMPNAR